MATITDAKKREIRAEMAKRFRKKMRQKGAASAIGGSAAAKLAGGTGSLKGAGYSATEKDYAKTIRAQQKGTTAKKDVARTSRATGKTSTPAITRQKMKATSKGGTVGKGTHKTGQARADARAWKKGRIAAAGGDRVKKSKIRKRFKRMVGG